MINRDAIVGQLDTGADTAVPRINGELVFSAPWESMVFALAVALSDGGAIDWTKFHRQLITEIQRWQQQAHPVEQWDYYQQWLTALEHVLCRRGLLSESELLGRIATLAAQDQH
ncbi:MAG TPA: nitrile hydratase accessory protein [Mycobacterium sp.]|uniref:nitrile hydratase accessory protein n=1 Tax=Mycobacterium sp. TaxID=1785 RepID=UPI002D327F21|nr:nitrile hydratase accessory protein [Mycobacterium sp.]HZU48857.1 nitrile hydratase accessory protein [Mycobacterium sp.]